MRDFQTADKKKLVPKMSIIHHMTIGVGVRMLKPTDEPVLPNTVKMVFLLTLPLAAVVYWLLWRWSHRRMLQLAALMPGPPALPVLGNALIFMEKPEDQLDVINKLFEKYGQYVRVWLGPDLNVCVKNPADIRLLLMSGKINQKGPLYKYMEMFIGPGILTGGPSWRGNRKAVMPSFSRKSMKYYAEIFNKESEILTETLLKKGQVTFDVYDEVLKTTSRSVCQTLMGLSSKEVDNIKRFEEFITSAHDLYTFVFTNMTHWWFQVPLVYWLAGRKSRERYIMRMVDDVAVDILEMRRRKQQEGGAVDEESCVVERLIELKLSEREIKWEILSILFASQDASAKIASAVLKILAHCPNWQDNVYNEIVEVLGSTDELVTEDQLKNLRYLDMVYKEAIRYFPIAGFIQRTVEEEITINDGQLTLPVGASVTIPIHAVHRDPQYWDEPSRVRPERFLPENCKGRDPNAFVPFSLGAMDCLGRVFAETLIKTIVIRVLRQLALEADGQLEDLELQVAISVSLDKGYKVRARPRHFVEIND